MNSHNSMIFYAIKATTVKKSGLCQMYPFQLNFPSLESLSVTFQNLSENYGVGHQQATFFLCFMFCFILYHTNLHMIDVPFLWLSGCNLYQIMNPELVADVLHKYKESFIDAVVNNYMHMVDEL